MHEQPRFNRSAAFRLGYIAGFYDAVADDGSRYLEDMMRFGLAYKEQPDFLEGYRIGRRLRRPLRLQGSEISVAPAMAA